MPDKYEVSYKVNYMGVVSTDSYIITVNDYGELMRSIDRLYEDDYVFDVTYKKLDKENE